jgi:hypothetical protein
MKLRVNRGFSEWVNHMTDGEKVFAALVSRIYMDENLTADTLLFFAQSDLRVLLTLPANFSPNGEFGKHSVPGVLLECYEFAFIDEHNIGIRPKTPAVTNQNAYYSRKPKGSFIKPSLEVEITDEVAIIQWGYLLGKLEGPVTAPFKLREWAGLRPYSVEKYHMRQMNNIGFGKDYWSKK